MSLGADPWLIACSLGDDSEEFQDDYSEDSDYDDVEERSSLFTMLKRAGTKRGGKPLPPPYKKTLLDLSALPAPGRTGRLRQWIAKALKQGMNRACCLICGQYQEGMRRHVRSIHIYQLAQVFVSADARSGQEDLRLHLWECKLLFLFLIIPDILEDPANMNNQKLLQDIARLDKAFGTWLPAHVRIPGIRSVTIDLGGKRFREADFQTVVKAARIRAQKELTEFQCICSGNPSFGRIESLRRHVHDNNNPGRPRPGHGWAKYQGDDQWKMLEAAPKVKRSKAT